MSDAPVALVSGGSRGIGRAVVKDLATRGYQVGFCYRANSSAAEELVSELTATGATVIARPCEVNDFEQVQEFVSEVKSELGVPSVLVTSAGITRDKPLVLMSAEDWQSVIDTNLTGTFNFCRSLVFDLMKLRGGSVVLLSSVAGVYGHAMQSNYAASKAGVIGLGKSLAKELARYGIRVNVVAPGFIETDMTAALSEKVKEQAKQQIPLGRLGSATEVAELIGYLCGKGSEYITGQVIGIDGGMTL